MFNQYQKKLFTLFIHFKRFKYIDISVLNDIRRKYVIKLYVSVKKHLTIKYNYLHKHLSVYYKLLQIFIM